MPEMKSNASRFKIIMPNVGREISDQGWQEIEPKIIHLMESLGKRFSNYKVEYERTSYSINIDFNEIARVTSDYHTRLTKFNSSKEFQEFEGFESEAVIDVICEVSSDAEDNHLDPSSIIQYLMIEAFVVANLAVPGSFNLRDSYLTDDPEQLTIRGDAIRYSLNMSSTLIENVLYDSAKYPYLKLRDITLSQTYAWVMQSCPRFNILPDNPSAKCVFALMHICKSAEYDAPAAIWVFYALESLFQCRVGENFSALVSRISLLLQLSAAESKQMKDNLRSLYDVRSAFVHGGLPVIHPLQNEAFDSRVDEETLKLMTLLDYAFTVTIASIQRLIHQNWEWPRFRERLEN